MQLLCAQHSSGVVPNTRKMLIPSSPLATSICQYKKTKNTKQTEYEHHDSGKTSSPLIFSLCHMPDLAEVGRYQHTQKSDPCHQPQKNSGKHWMTRSHKESRKPSTQALGPGMPEMSFRPTLGSRRPSHNRNNQGVWHLTGRCARH